jgi:hypothetical protein
MKGVEVKKALAVVMTQLCFIVTALSHSIKYGGNYMYHQL